MRTRRITHVAQRDARPAPEPSARARTTAEAGCARRQRLAVPALVGGPLAFFLATGLYAYAATGPAERAEIWSLLGTVCLLASIGLLAWGAHFMDCTDKVGPPPRSHWDED